MGANQVVRGDGTAHIVEGDLAYAIVGACYEVFNALGYGFLESVYARGVRVALQRRGVPYACEVPVSVVFHGVQIGTYRADLIVDRKVLVEIKSQPGLTPADFRQALNYVRATGLDLGPLVNFGPNGVTIRRIAASKGRPSER